MNLSTKVAGQEKFLNIIQAGILALLQSPGFIEAIGLSPETAQALSVVLLGTIGWMTANTSTKKGNQE